MLGLSLGLSLGAQAGGGAFAPDFFVDSVNGSDSNDGLTDLTPKQNLTSGVSLLSLGKGLALAKDSEWQQAATITSLSNVRLTNYGTGALPYIDAAGEVTETWDQTSGSANSTTYPNMWATTVTHGFTNNQTRLPIWEDGVLLTRTTSLASCNSTPGSFYSPSDEALNSNPNALVYVHASDSGNPNSNGKLYEIARREWAINGAFGAGSGQIVEKVKVGRQAHNDGAITLGLNSTMRQVLAIDGHKHNALQQSGTCEDSIFLRAQQVNGYLHVFYNDDAAGLTASHNRVGCIGNSGSSAISTGALGLYAHDNAGSAHASMSVTQSWFVGIGTPIASAAQSLTADGNYWFNCNVMGSVGSTTIAVRRSMTNRAVPTAVINFIPETNNAAVTYENNAMYVATGVALQNFPVIRTGASGQSFTIANNTVVCRSEKLPLLRDITSNVNSYTIQDNILVAAGSFGFVLVELSPNRGTTVIDYNVYYYDGTKAQMRFDANGTSLTIAQWQALGYDTNSIFLDTTDIALDDLFLNGLAGVAAGDFRLATDTGLTFGDGTPIHERAGVQSHWDWASRAAASGAPTVWPTVPISEADCETYCDDPTAWDFYP